jgi:hypothetical protein
MTMRVGAVGNCGLCGFPSRCGRVLCVHSDGSVHAHLHCNSLVEESDRRREWRIDSWPRARRASPVPIGRGCFAAPARSISLRPRRLGKWPRVLMIVRSCAWTLSSALVVSMMRRISGGNAKNGMTRDQARRQAATRGESVGPIPHARMRRAPPRRDRRSGPSRSRAAPPPATCVAANSQSPDSVAANARCTSAGSSAGRRRRGPPPSP